MREVIIKETIYQFSELPEPAQERAINHEIEAMQVAASQIEIPDDSNLGKAIKQAETMRTPWFTGQYIWEHCKSEITESLNQLEFFKDGSIFVPLAS